MKYLLIDFGASRIKCCVYDTKTENFTKNISYVSPFIEQQTLEKKELLKIINNILLDFNSCKRAISCSILGGEWIGDTYFSWKALKTRTKPDSLLSGLFINSSQYHIHKHHGGNTIEILPLGYINDVLWYSDLGDTDCVINSIDLSNNNKYLINIGTGSQVISKNIIHKYIPAGRALLVFNKFFNSIGFDFFKRMGELTLDQIINSSLTIDLNVFEQAHLYKAGGMIGNITENNFNIDNIFGSILRTLVCQYKSFIDNDDWPITLAGGIPTKLPVIKLLFEHYYKNPIILSTHTDTHIGLAKFAHTI